MGADGEELMLAGKPHTAFEKSTSTVRRGTLLPEMETEPGMETSRGSLICCFPFLAAERRTCDRITPQLLARQRHRPKRHTAEVFTLMRPSQLRIGMMPVATESFVGLLVSGVFIITVSPLPNSDKTNLFGLIELI